MIMSAPRPVSTPPTEAGKADIVNLELLLSYDAEFQLLLFH
jgi:hypothetical protein